MAIGSNLDLTPNEHIKKPKTKLGMFWEARCLPMMFNITLWAAILYTADF